MRLFGLLSVVVLGLVSVSSAHAQTVRVGDGSVVGAGACDFTMVDPVTIPTDTLNAVGGDATRVFWTERGCPKVAFADNTAGNLQTIVNNPPAQIIDVQVDGGFIYVLKENGDIFQRDNGTNTLFYLLTFSQPNPVKFNSVGGAIYVLANGGNVYDVGGNPAMPVGNNVNGFDIVNLGGGSFIYAVTNTSILKFPLGLSLQTLSPTIGGDLIGVNADGLTGDLIIYQGAQARLIRYNEATGQSFLIAGGLPIVTDLYVTPGEVTVSTDRQVMTYATGGGPVPVTLVDFSVTPAAAGLSVTWITAQEVNSDFFAIQYSTDTRHWTTAGRVQARGYAADRTAYEFIDQDTPRGISTLYVRLKQVDQDGTFAYSQVVPVSLTEPQNIRLYPNPASTYITLTGPAARETLAIISSTGQRYRLTAVGDRADISHLPGGFYLLKRTGHTTVQRLFIHR